MIITHYLEALLRKPRAVRDACAMQTADVPQEMRDFHRLMNEKHGAEGDRGFVRFLLLHREVGMDILLQTVQTAQVAGIFRYEGLHQIVRQLTGQESNSAALPTACLPADLTAYRVRKADLNRYGELTSGGAVK